MKDDMNPDLSKPEPTLETIKEATKKIQTLEEVVLLEAFRKL
jgi:hypothetical protein